MKTKKQLIGYIRVSTEEQGVAGNGLEAQTRAILKFAEDNDYEVLEIAREEASGKLGLEDRPVLKAALAKALKLKVAVIVSKLDRLSRQASFILNLMNTKAKFIVAALGEAVDDFMLHMYAVLAEKERKMISDRTKDALQSLKEKGVKLGNRTNIAAAGVLARAASAAKADVFAERMRPAIRRMRATGMTLGGIAAEFNDNGTKTARNGVWTAQTVSNMIARWA